MLNQIVTDGENLKFVSDRHSSIYAGLAKVTLYYFEYSFGYLLYIVDR